MPFRLRRKARAGLAILRLPTPRAMRDLAMYQRRGNDVCPSGV
jgi:hypothetical protein